MDPALAAAGVMAVAAAVAYSAISLYRHDHFGSTVDLATQDQTVWGYSTLRVIPNTIIGVPNLLGDHFHPVLFLLAPFYWLWDSPGVLLVAQAVLLAAAGVPIYLWGAEKLGRLAGLAFLAAFYTYWGILSGVLFDFHHVVFAVTAISWAMYATLTHRNRLLWAMVAVAMLTREDAPLTVIALGAYIAVFQRRWITGAVMMGVNAIWFGALLGFVMPALAGMPYRHWTYTSLGSGPASAALHVITHPLQSLELLFTPFAKTRVWIGTFGNWLFLPVLSPIVLITVPTWLERFWNDWPSFWTFHMQYSMLPAPILAFASIDTIVRLRRVLPERLTLPSARALAGLTLAASLVASFVVIKPLAELSQALPNATVADIQACLSVIPPDASVAATQELLPHLAHRDKIYGIPVNLGDEPIANPVTMSPDYIAIDLASGGSPDVAMRAAVNSAFASGYGIVCMRELTLILEKGATDQQLSPDFQRWLAGECRAQACLTTKPGG